MGLSPEFLAHCTDDLELLYHDLETAILVDIAERIRLNDSTSNHQKQVLKSLGMLENEINKQLAEILDISNNEIESIMNESADLTIEADGSIYKKVGLKVTNTNYLEKIVAKELVGTKKTISNICKTTGKNAKNTFVHVCDRIFLAVSSGAFDYNTAYQMAIEDLSRDGTGWINYKSGARRRVDSAVRQTVRTAVNQSSLKCQDDLFEEMGGNLVETSSHVGARPDHASWQGQIFYRKKKVSGYSNFEIATNYMRVDGLGGVNCRHSWYPFFPELGSTQTKSDISDEDNEEFYELEQTQRYNERMIREWKRRNEVVKAAGLNNSKELNKVREWNKRQKAFLDAHPQLKRDYSREKVVKVQQESRQIEHFWKKSDILEVSKTKLIEQPFAVTQTRTKKGVITRNFYDKNGRQYKQITADGHGNIKNHPYGIFGEHAHDYVYDSDGKLIDRATRELTQKERDDNDEIFNQEK